MAPMRQSASLRNFALKGGTNKEDIEIADRDDTVIRLKDENDFDEAYNLLKKRGFKNLYGEEIVRTDSSKAAMMVSPSGFNICVIQHLE